MKGLVERISYLKQTNNNKMSSKVKVLQEFKSQLVDFFDALIIQFPTDSDLCILRIFFNNQIDIIKVMNIFITKLLPLKDIVKRRDVNFFLGTGAASLFEGFDRGKVNYFKVLWQSDSLDDEDRTEIWKWFDLFINISEKYTKIVD